MSEPDLTPEWDTPCEFCMAEAGEKCAPDCVALTENWPAVTIDAEVEPETLTREAQRAIMARLYRLPMVGSRASNPPVYGDKDVDMWLADIAVWLGEYSNVIHAELEHLQKEARKAIGLQFEKDVVRRFLLGDNVPLR